jgi:hypothetical protein
MWVDVLLLFSVELKYYCIIVWRVNTEDAVQIANFFITIPTTRNYNHSQLFLSCVTFTQLTILHIPNPYSICHTVFLTHLTSSHFPCLSPIETSLVEQLLNNCSRELLLKNFQQFCLWEFPTVNCFIAKPLYTGKFWKKSKVSLWTSLDNLKHSPTPGAYDVIAAWSVETVFQCCCVTSSRLRGNLVYRLALEKGLRNPTMGWHAILLPP